MTQGQGRCIIGLTGSFGSGCSYVAQNVLVHRGYKLASLSKALRDLFQQQKAKDPTSVPRCELQDFGDEIRGSKGPDFFGRKVLEEIQKSGADDKWVVDSIRNPAEARALRNYSQRFYLFGVFADRDNRWRRVKAVYGDDRRRFEEDDANDIGDRSAAYGQRVGDCFYEADVVFANDKHIDAVGNSDFARLAGRIGTFVELVENPLTRKQPSDKEALMAIAYALSQRSSCAKRKVGAVIVDAMGNIISSGYNEVPSNEQPCNQQYVSCYRDYISDKFFATLKEAVPAVEGQEEQLRTRFREQFRILDLCRALHAEENAIVNLARSGHSESLSKCKLYTTTYPCRLCANKIVNLGLKQIVYMEPYPDPEAKIILTNAEVKSEFFEGVTSRGFFRVYGEQK